MLQCNSKCKGKGTSLPHSQHPFLQPPSVAISEEDNQQIRMMPTPPTIVRRELSTGHMAASTDSERTMSTGPSTSTSHMAAGPSTSNSEPNSSTGNSELSNNQNKTFIHPIGDKSFEPVEANRKIMPCIMRIFPEAVKTFTVAPQHLKDVWFNEFKKKHQWDPNDKDAVRMETVTQLEQTQPEVAESTLWLEATGGVRKGGMLQDLGRIAYITSPRL